MIAKRVTQAQARARKNYVRTENREFFQFGIFLWHLMVSGRNTTTATISLLANIFYVQAILPKLNRAHVHLLFCFFILPKNLTS
jgi:hypothetical protein